MSVSIEQQLLLVEKIPTYNELVRQKNIFLFSVTGIFLFIYILLPILAFKPFLQTPVLGAITGVWFYSAGLFLMTVILCTLYVRQAAKFDKKMSVVLNEYQKMLEGK